MRLTFAKLQNNLLTLLRIAIGWHFLYEGIAKLLTPGWSSAPYLQMSHWILAPVFQTIAGQPALLLAVDILNIAFLIIIGLLLILGVWIRIVCLTGTVLLLLYYIASPPLIGKGFGVSSEGHYLIIDKNVIEMIALLILAIQPGGTLPGLNDLVKRSPKPAEESAGIKTLYSERIGRHKKDRRQFLKGLTAFPFLGIFAYAVLRKKTWESVAEQNLADSVTSASVKSFNFSSLDSLKGQIPKAKIASCSFSRLILGGNLIGGWAHARDLIYVSKLVKAYHHRDKIFETLLLAEKCGINALLTNPLLCGVIREYWRRNIGKIQFISDCGGEDLMERIRVSIDSGAAACYIQGGVADTLVREGKLDVIGQGLELIRKNKLPAGIGAHFIETIQACVEYGLQPDFWMKTLHHHRYWSVQPSIEMDNIFCRKPQETIDFMKTLSQPWIAFKVLAAGAIAPMDGFRFAFENGADFICVGMYDFQIVDDANTVLDVLNQNLNRTRPWRA